MTAKMTNMARTMAMLLTATILLSGCISEKKNDEPNSLPIGAQMPEFSVTGPDGVVTSADLAGKRAVVVFFRTTCPDCSREMPGVDEAARRIGPQSDLRFVTISKESDATTVVPEYWENTGMTLPYYFDTEGIAFTSFDIHYVPTLYLFGSDGKVVHVEVETFQSSVDKLINMIEEIK